MLFLLCFICWFVCCCSSVTWRELLLKVLIDAKKLTIPSNCKVLLELYCLELLSSTQYSQSPRYGLKQIVYISFPQNMLTYNISTFFLLTSAVASNGTRISNGKGQTCAWSRLDLFHSLYLVFYSKTSTKCRIEKWVLPLGQENATADILSTEVSA